MEIESYKRLNDAIKYYSALGYKYVNLPWVVPVEISDITRPEEKSNFYVHDKVLVASGEQSFLELSLNGTLIPGKYFGITPCFRNELILDKLHQTYFMKLELYQTNDTSNDSLKEILYDAKHFFNLILGPIFKTLIEITDEGFDITTEKGTELGSYGIREHNSFKWVYGTGLAEPRLTTALNELKNV